jgi:hypothetical protein
MIAQSQSGILNRIVDMASNGWTQEGARQLLALDFAPSDHERMHALSDKAQEGALTQDEQEELDNYLRIAHLIALLHSKARIFLKKNTGES